LSLPRANALAAIATAKPYYGRCPFFFYRGGWLGGKYVFSVRVIVAIGTSIFCSTLLDAD
jgi:hypothetical protein